MYSVKLKTAHFSFIYNPHFKRNIENCCFKFPISVIKVMGKDKHLYAISKFTDFFHIKQYSFEKQVTKPSKNNIEI